MEKKKETEGSILTCGSGDEKKGLDLVSWRWNDRT